MGTQRQEEMSEEETINKITLQISKLVESTKDPFVALELMRNKINSSMRIISAKLDYLSNRVAGKDTGKVIIKDFHAIGIIGAAPNYKAGHHLTLDSFSQRPLGLWKLKDLTDSSGNSNTLTDIGTVNFGSTDIMGGTEGVRLVNPANSECMHATGTDFDDTGSFTVGGWFRLLDTGVTEMIMSKYGAVNANKSWYLTQSVAGVIELRVYYDNAGSSKFVSTPAKVYEGTDEHHLFIGVYDQTQKSIKLNINGQTKGYLENASLAARNNSAVYDLTIGALDGSGAPTWFSDSQISNCFYCDWAMKQEEINLIYATKYEKPLALQGKDYEIFLKGKPNGVDKFESRLSWGGMEVSDTRSNIFRHGNIFTPSDEIQIYGRLM